MPITPPQVRSVDPYSENRFSSAINRLTRIVTGGRDVVLLSNESFELSYDDSNDNYSIITVGPGLCVKDDVTIHITDDVAIDLRDNDYYIDDTPGMISSGYYYLVLKYQYNRILPAPKAVYKIIRNKSLYTMYQSSLIFLGTILIGFNSDETRYEIIEINTSDPSEEPPRERPVSILMPSEIDGGWIS